MASCAVLFVFVCLVSFAKLDGGTVTKCNFAGDENAGASWTEKIMVNKADQENPGKSGGQGEGADDEEWVRFYAQLMKFCVCSDHINNWFRKWVYHKRMCNLFPFFYYSIIKRFKTT